MFSCIQTMPKVSSLPNTAERLKKDPANSSPPTTKSIHNSQSSPKLTPPTTATRLTDPKISEHKPSANTTSTLNTASKPVEMATRVTSNPVKQTTPRPISNEIPNHSVKFQCYLYYICQTVIYFYFMENFSLLILLGRWSNQLSYHQHQHQHQHQQQYRIHRINEFPRIN